MRKHASRCWNRSNPPPYNQKFLAFFQKKNVFSVKHNLGILVAGHSVGFDPRTHAGTPDDVG